jgi:tetratricopeptide (TPR) repeat protein
MERLQAPESQMTVSEPAERRLGPYRLTEPIGRGGMGVIWRAEDTRLGRTVAVKLLPPDLAQDHRFRARFLQGARAASALDHPNICSIHEVGETEDGQLYLVMPCYDGETLEDRLARGRMPVSEALDAAAQIARGIARAHEKGIVHRDIKPANLMLTGDGTLKILDFGIAKGAGGSLTRSGFVVGTLAYMSPERISGKTTDERTDLWSLGVVIYEMLAGRHPFDGGPFDRGRDAVFREAILNGEPEPLSRLRPDIPAGLDQLVAALLEKDPGVRIERVAARLGALAREARFPLFWRPWMGLMLSVLVLSAALGPAWKGNGPILLMPGASRASVSTSSLLITPPAASPDGRRSVAVLGFRNLSDDAGQTWLGPALTEMLTAELAAGAKLRVVSSERTAAVRQSLSLSETSRLELPVLESLHGLVGTDLAVTGTYLSLGGRDPRRLRLDLRILKLPEGEIAASLVETGSEAELFDLVARLGSKLRGALGFSLPSPEERRETRGLLPAGSGALRFYSEALWRLRSFDSAGARDFLLRAEALEPGSAVIQSALSEAWEMQGDNVQVHEAAQRAFGARHSLPEDARLAVEAHYYETEKEWQRASEIYRSLRARGVDELEYGLKLANALSKAGRGLQALAVLADLRGRPGPGRNEPRIDVLEANVAWQLSDYLRMEAAAKAAVAKSRRLGAGLIAARALIPQAFVSSVQGRPHEAVELLRQAEQLALRAGDRWTAGRVQGNLGRVLQQEGELDEAEKVSQRSLAIARKLGSAIGISTQLYALGQLHRERGNLRQARALLEESLEWFHRMGYGLWEVHARTALASIDLAEGDPAGARRHLEESLAMSRLLRNPEVETKALLGMARLKMEEGDLEEAFRLQESALSLLLDLPTPRLAAAALADSAELLARMGNLPLARLRLLQAEAVSRRAADRLLTGQLLETRAELAFRSGDLAASRSASEEQLRLARRSGARPLETAALQSLARAARAAGESRGARLPTNPPS